jgi:hypothetical protein
MAEKKMTMIARKKRKRKKRKNGFLQLLRS